VLNCSFAVISWTLVKIKANEKLSAGMVKVIRQENYANVNNISVVQRYSYKMYISTNVTKIDEWGTKIKKENTKQTES
jgi:hypothetical protein